MEVTVEKSAVVESTDRQTGSAEDPAAATWIVLLAKGSREILAGHLAAHEKKTEGGPVAERGGRERLGGRDPHSPKLRGEGKLPEGAGGIGEPLAGQEPQQPAVEILAHEGGARWEPHPAQDAAAAQGAPLPGRAAPRRVEETRSEEGLPLRCERRDPSFLRPLADESWRKGDGKPEAPGIRHEGNDNRTAEGWQRRPKNHPQRPPRQS